MHPSIGVSPSQCNGETETNTLFWGSYLPFQAWKFVDYGPDYTCFIDAGIDGGFYQSDNDGYRSENCPLIVFYYYDIDEVKDKVVALSGNIVKDAFSFPGGRRFHFTDLNNNEYAIWTDKPE